MSDLPPVPPGALPGGGLPAEYPAGPPLADPHPPVPPGAMRPGASWPVPEPPPPPQPNRRAWIVVAAVVAALVLAAIAYVVLDDDEDPNVAFEPTPTQPDADPTPTPETEPEPGPAPAPEGDFDAVVAEIQAFVEAERGLAFQRPVEVELADDEEFEARLLEDFEEDVPDLEVQGRVLEAVGLVEPGTDLVEATRALLGAGVVGFYDPATDELVVRGTSTSPYVRTVIAHELVHALDDQHFELERPALDDATDESGFGFTGLVEGNARRIEERYRATFSEEEEREAFGEELAVGADVDLFGVPPVLLQLIAAPYVLGPELVDAILASGGQARLDAAFASPPTTSEHLLQPSTYVDGEAAVPVEAPVADGGAPVVDEGVLGALGLAEILGVGPFTLPGVGGGDVDESIAGWGGDRYVAWDDPAGGTCLRAVVVGDTEGDTRELAAALAEWADDAPFGIEVVVDGGEPGTPVTFTACSG